MDTVKGVPALIDRDPASLIGQYSRDLRAYLRGTDSAIVPTSPYVAQGSPPEDITLIKIGDWVFAEWGWSGTGMAANSSYSNIGVVPTGFRPLRSTGVSFIAQTAGAQSGVRGFISTGGVVSINTGPATSGYYLFAAGTAWRWRNSA